MDLLRAKETLEYWKKEGLTQFHCDKCFTVCTLKADEESTECPKCGHAYEAAYVVYAQLVGIDVKEEMEQRNRKKMEKQRMDLRKAVNILQKGIDRGNLEFLCPRCGAQCGLKPSETHTACSSCGAGHDTIFIIHDKLLRTEFKEAKKRKGKK